jgi:ATP-dependent protease HslVU (ClpYQ) peptidase subunit
MDYALLASRADVRSVANSTRDDVRECLRIAAEVPVETAGRTTISSTRTARSRT